MMVGIAVYGHILGGFKQIKFDMAKVSYMYQDISYSAEIAMQNLLIPESVEEKATKFVKLQSLLTYHCSTIDDFFKLVSPSLTNRVNSQLVMKLLFEQ